VIFNKEWYNFHCCLPEQHSRKKGEALMADYSIKDEIEELRAQVAELKAERKSEGGKQAPDRERQPPPDVPEQKKPGEDESEVPGPSDLTIQFQELFEVIDEELKAENPLTMLAIFALGVLVGRLLPK
jgi:hypothetical protein